MLGWYWPTASRVSAAQCSNEGKGWQTQTERGGASDPATTEEWGDSAKKCWHQQTSERNKKVAGQCSQPVACTPNRIQRINVIRN